MTRARDIAGRTAYSAPLERKDLAPDQELTWLIQKALQTAAATACSNERCQADYKACTKARNNPYRLQLDDIQKNFYDTSHYIRTWQQYAFAQIAKPVVCSQKSRISDEKDQGR